MLNIWAVSLGVAGNKGGLISKLCLGWELRVMRSEATSSTEFLPGIRTSRQLPRAGSPEPGVAMLEHSGAGRRDSQSWHSPG